MFKLNQFMNNNNIKKKIESEIKEIIGYTKHIQSNDYMNRYLTNSEVLLLVKEIKRLRKELKKQ